MTFNNVHFRAEHKKISYPLIYDNIFTTPSFYNLIFVLVVNHDLVPHRSSNNQ